MTRLTDEERALRAISEGQLERWVTGQARKAGWLCHHERRSTYSTGDQGFPDWTFARVGRTLFVELKRETEDPWEAQNRWLGVLSTGPCEVYVWRPSDWVNGRIQEVLK